MKKEKLLMNLVIHLSPETEAKLKEQASREGKKPETLALEALEDRLTSSESGTLKMPLGEWLNELNDAPNRLPAGNPNADFSREGLYEGRGE
jgi:hypothetical protein